MLGIALGAQARGVGGEEGERVLLIALVFGEVEVDPTDDLPGRILSRQNLLYRARRRADLASPRPQKRIPLRFKEIDGDVFTALHGGRGSSQRLQIRAPDGNVHTIPLRLDLRSATEGGNEHASEVSPKAKCRRKRRSDLDRTEMQKSRGLADLKGVADPPCKVGVQGRFIREGRAQQHVPLRGKR